MIPPKACVGRLPIAPVSKNSDLASHDAACAAVRPDAPTALDLEPSGSDKIEDAASAKGVPYATLPVALRSRTALDTTRAGRRSAALRYSQALLRDVTLRKGDSIMTPSGFVVFQGWSHLPFAREDFVALAQASMPNDNRAQLQALERASAARNAPRSAPAQPP